MKTTSSFRHWWRNRPRLRLTSNSNPSNPRNLPARIKGRSRQFWWGVGLVLAGELLLLAWIGLVAYLVVTVAWLLLVAGVVMLWDDRQTDPGK